MKIAMLGLALTTLAATAAALPPPASESARVRDVIAPDAVRLTLRGRIETIELIGVDSSDYDRPGKDVEQMRDRAVQYAASLALGQTVTLQPDSRLPDRNADGRLLRYVVLPSGALLNTEMLTAGWLRVAQKPFFGRFEDFQKLEAEARTAGRGIWKGAAPATASSSAPQGSILAVTSPARPAGTLRPVATMTPRAIATMTPRVVATLTPRAPIASTSAIPPHSTPATAPAKPSPILPPAAPVAAKAAAATPASAASKEPAKPAATGTADRAEVSAFLDRWLDAWRSRSLDKYLGFYAKGFSGDGLDLDGWRARKKRVFAGAGDIHVAMRDLEVSGTAEHPRVRFTQEYRSAASSDAGIKTMELTRDGGNWKIAREDWKAR